MLIKNLECSSSSQTHFLIKCIADVVSRVCGDDEDRGSDFGQLNGDGARARRLAHSPLASHKDPPQGLLVKQVLERGRSVHYASLVTVLSLLVPDDEGHLFSTG